ncbi:MAG: helix-turn-helix domain-containing protein [Acidobacteria bacterium]|nr:helix-turn-helix domain-containing protein [Acidobacteriota bacterium]
MPVYTSHLVDFHGLQIESRIRQERQRKGLSLRDMAARTQISAARLSNIETGKKVPDVEEVTQIAAALEVPIVALVPPSVQHHYLIKRAKHLSDEPPIARRLMGPEPGPERHHNSVWPLADAFVGKQMEPVLAHIQPLPDDVLHYISHDHEEFMFVLRGEVESFLQTNDGLKTERLRPGDCVYFRSYLPHCHRSATASPAETLNVIYSLRGGIDLDSDELGASPHHFYRRGVYGNVLKEVAEKIALLRRARGLTVAELAQMVGLKPRQLAHIERGETTPDLALLHRLSVKFRRPLEYFFATTLESQPSYFVQRGDKVSELPTRERRTDGERSDATNVFRALASGFPGRGVHPYYVQIRTREPALLRPEEHPGQEFIYVLDGEIELVTYVGDEQVTEILRPGDALFLESSAPHLLRGHSRNPYADTSAEIIDVFWVPLGEDYLFTH